MNTLLRAIVVCAALSMVGAASLRAQTSTPGPGPAAKAGVPAAKAVTPAAPTPEPPSWSDAEIGKIGDMLKGTWKTTVAVGGSDGAPGAEIVMSIAPVRIKDLPDAMYVESARADSMDAPYRRSLFQLFRYKDRIRLRTWEAITTEARSVLEEWTGFWAAPECLPVMTATGLPRSGLIATLDLDISARADGAPGFVGRTPYPFPNGNNGAVEMTSELTLSPDSVTTADRGLDAKGNVVWGAGEKDGYTFTRYSAPSPVVVRKDSGLVMLWYKRVTEGHVIAMTDRFYVHYTSWLPATGAELERTRTRGAGKAGGPFALKGVEKVAMGALPAWAIALDGVAMGSRVRLFAPSALAFGDRDVVNAGKLTVPAGSPLVFDLEVMFVESQEVATKPRAVPVPPGALPVAPK